MDANGSSMKKAVTHMEADAWFKEVISSFHVDFVLFGQGHCLEIKNLCEGIKYLSLSAHRHSLDVT